MSEQENNHAERIGKLETAFQNLATVVGDLKQGQQRIETAIGDIGKPNFSNWIAAGALLLSFALVIYGAAIHPLNQDITREETSAAKLAEAVLVQNDRQNKLENTLVRLTDRQDDVREAIKRFDEQGSSAADKRLSLIEYRLNNERKEK